MNLLLHKQDITITITQKVVEKAVETVKKQSTNTTFTYAQKAAQNMSAKMSLKVTKQTKQNTICETSTTQLSWTKVTEKAQKQSAKVSSETA